MNVERIPLIGQVLESGADDRVLDGLLLSGPIVIALIVLLGRNLLTEGIAVTYLLVFVGYVAYLGLQRT
ncbi:putative membrane protein [Halapricum desulfuricans]|uniref:Putative membrane protein n=2 Tax=Halapricum desulfuricans TaxID=2841257 RepID=A0A897NIL0_9EURY|nr:hypothetical protein [Halapricum desulfuricans]QSG11275.1 putative membrane protein [Halapricum desulfuricans]